MINETKTIPPYLPPTPHKRRWRRISLLCLIAALPPLYAVCFMDLVESRWEIDAVTASNRTTTRWLYVIETTGPVSRSPLEARLVTESIPWAPVWRPCHYSTSALLGYMCGRRPPIYWFKGDIAEFAKVASVDELKRFVAVMQTGSEANQETELARARDLCFERIYRKSNPTVDQQIPEGTK